VLWCFAECAPANTAVVPASGERQGVKPCGINSLRLLLIGND
jgi:hypothetical protein